MIPKVVFKKLNKRKIQKPQNFSNIRFKKLFLSLVQMRLWGKQEDYPSKFGISSLKCFIFGKILALNYLFQIILQAILIKNI
jgi:hypothetical protein